MLIIRTNPIVIAVLLYIGLLVIYPQLAMVTIFVIASCSLVFTGILGVIKILELFGLLRLKYINQQRLSALLSLLEKEAQNQKFEVVDYRTTLKGVRGNDNYQITVSNGKITLTNIAVK